MMDIYIELKSWQTAIGSLLGFMALILGALFNYKLNRRRDEKIRREEMLSVASALYGEIIILRHSVARMANAVAYRYMRFGFTRGEAIDQHFVEQFSVPHPKLFPELSGKVGILESRIAQEIVLFYSRVEQSQTWLPRLEDDEKRPYTYGVNYVLDPAIEAVNGIVPTLRHIERMAGIPEADPVDLAQALDTQELEKERWNE